MAASLRGEHLGIDPVRRHQQAPSGTPSRPTCSAISTEPQATTSAASEQRASAERSRMPCQPVA